MIIHDHSYMKVPEYGMSIKDRTFEYGDLLIQFKIIYPSSLTES